jgi:iron complex outermembrane receptor protein
MRKVGWLVGASLLLVPQVAMAQAPGDSTDEFEIVVTALKREQNINDVPASLTALGADDLAASGITSSFDLQQRVPGLAISFGNRETNVAIRGVSNNVRSVGSDPSNAVHLNGIYLPQSSMILTDLFDVQRVEVLKGPQGTLYGRNATGGAINVIARAPEAGTSIEGMLGYGSYNLFRGQAALNVGNDAVAGRIAVSYAKDDGYTRNLSNGTRLDRQDFRGFRGQLRFKLAENLTLSLLTQVVRDDGNVGYGASTDPTYRKFPDNYYGLVVPAALQRQGPRNIRLDSPVYSRRDSEIYGATLDLDLGSVGMRSITGYSHYDSADALDYDFTGDFNEAFNSTTTVKAFSQEFQLYSKGKGPLQWTTGFFFYDDKGEQFVNWIVPSPFARANTIGDGQSWAIFGQGTYAISERLSIMVGARYNHENKKGLQVNLLRNVTANVDKTFESFTPQGQIQFRPSDNTLIYAGVTKGFKSGGFNLLASGPPTVYKPESIIAYEAGVRTKIADVLTLNASVFHYDYKNLQLRTLVFTGTGTGGGALASVSNADGAKISGLELNADAKLGSGFSVDLGATYLHTEFGSYISPSNKLDLTGTRLPLSPKFSGTAGLNWEGGFAGGKLMLRGEVVYRSSIIFPLTIDAPQNYDDPSTLFNASLRWTESSDRFYVEVVGRNIADRLYRVQRADIFFGGVYESFGAPATVEARIGFKF